MDVIGYGGGDAGAREHKGGGHWIVSVDGDNGKRRYSVLAERDDDDVWLLRVPQLGLASGALRREEIEETAREMIATSLDVDAHSFDLDIETLST